MAIYSFGDCVIDTDRYELRRAGEPVPVEPQVLDLLLHLVRNPDRLVTKEEIFEAVWKGRVVSESALSVRISAARRAIGDGGGDNGQLRTVFRRGFRFRGRVEVSEAPRRDERRRSVAGFTGPDRRIAGRGHLAGMFACYSNAWSPAFEGWVIRGSLTITADADVAGCQAVYAETLRNGTTLCHAGAVNLSERTLSLDLVDRQTDSRVLLVLRFPGPPATALLGVMSGKVFHHPNTEIAASRFVAVRVPDTGADRLAGSNRYLDPARESIAGDLKALGLSLQVPSPLDWVLADFLRANGTAGLFRVTAGDNEAVNVALDRALAGPAAATAER